jgi:hypothetical protein
MRPPKSDPSSGRNVARYTPDSRGWRYAFAGVSAVLAPILFYDTTRLISSTWSGTVPSLLVLAGAVSTLATAALAPTLLLAPAGGGRANGAEANGSAIAELKRRYASGEVSEAEFERRLETLMDPAVNGDPRSSARHDGAGTGQDAVEAEAERNDAVETT